jgi:hypothetical protein
MSTNNKSTHRCVVALSLEKPVPALVTQATNFVTGCGGGVARQRRLWECQRTARAYAPGVTPTSRRNGRASALCWL